ncbi:hypothetical protein [Acinetobacter pittii]|uniref:hypothetical protein n=1 Tax=Acinetobacter pittii TaxID=48296 RepID=UPI0025B012A3|nr:hypothetical protein [Acinetobacter pittii]
MRTSSQLFPENQSVTIDDLIAARSEAKNDMGDINALLLAIELSLVEKLKDLDLGKLAFDKTLRLIEIAKTQADLSQDYHNGELAQLTGGQYQLDELKSSISNLDSHQESEETKVSLNCLAPANSMISKTLNTNFQKLDINGFPEKQRLSIRAEGFKHDGRR